MTADVWADTLASNLREATHTAGGRQEDLLILIVLRDSSFK